MANVRHVAGRLDIATSLSDLLADERAKAILVRHLGEEPFKGPQMRWMMDQPLEGMARFAAHVLTPEKLQVIQQELIAL